VTISKRTFATGSTHATDIVLYLVLSNPSNHVSTLWNSFKEKLFDAKRKLGDISLSKMYCKVKNEIEYLGTGTIGTFTVGNFYKRRTNPRTKF
jgi:hypothetical protein